MWLQFSAIDARLKPILDAINELRRHVGKEPISTIPKGRRYNGTYCPLAQALANGETVQVGRNSARIGGRSLSLPPILSRFIYEFDSGKWPSLELRN